MARVGSSDWLDVGSWADEDTPGAGGQNFTTDINATGLNGNFMRLWKAITQFFSTYGTVANDKIDGNALKNTVADGSTLETSAASGAKTFRIKDSGVVAAKIASDAVTTAKILDANVTAAKLASDAVTTAKILDANVTTAKLADDAVTPAKMSHDSNARRLMLAAMVPTGQTRASWGNANGASVHGLVMLRAGIVTGVTICDGTTPTTATDSQVYAASGGAADGRFAAGDRISVVRNTSTGNVQPTVNGTNITNLLIAGVGGFATDDLVVGIEVEFDD